MQSPHARPAGRLRAFIDNSGLLVLGALLALAWANVAHDSYESLTHALRFVVNDIGMVFFFALATAEVLEATRAGGPLGSRATAGTPLLAAAGGMIGPALMFLVLTTMRGHAELARGWAIPCATDIAFSALVARFIFGRAHPAVPFLLMLAIADDALGLLILAVFYPSGPLHPVEGVAWMAAAMAAAWWLRRRHVTNFWPYVIAAGSFSWMALFRGGLHPALALVPVLPFLPRATADEAAHARGDGLKDFEHWWTLPVECVLFFFGLANAGVSLTSVGAGSWIVLAAMLVGKPVGISGAVALARALRLQLSPGMTWREVLIVGASAAIGFTVAMFFAIAAFDPGPLLDQVKMGALLSFSAALMAAALAAALRVGRFGPVRGL